MNKLKSVVLLSFLYVGNQCVFSSEVLSANDVSVRGEQTRNIKKYDILQIAPKLEDVVINLKDAVVNLKDPASNEQIDYGFFGDILGKLSLDIGNGAEVIKFLKAIHDQLGFFAETKVNNKYKAICIDLLGELAEHEEILAAEGMTSTDGTSVLQIRDSSEGTDGVQDIQIEQLRIQLLVQAENARQVVAAQAYNREKILEFEKEQGEKQERAILIEERKNSDLIWEQEHKARHEQSMIELSALIGRNGREKKLENMFDEYFKWMKGEWTKFRNRQYAEPNKSGRAMVQRKYAQLVQLRAEGSDLHEALYAAKTIVEMDDILEKLFANLNDRKALVEE